VTLRMAVWLQAKVRDKITIETTLSGHGIPLTTGPKTIRLKTEQTN